MLILTQIKGCRVIRGLTLFRSFPIELISGKELLKELDMFFNGLDKSYPLDLFHACSRLQLTRTRIAEKEKEKMDGCGSEGGGKPEREREREREKEETEIRASKDRSDAASENFFDQGQILAKFSPFSMLDVIRIR